MEELSGNMTITTFIEATIIPYPQNREVEGKPVRFYRVMTLSEAPKDLKPTDLPVTSSQSIHLSTHTAAGEDVNITARVITRVVHDEHLQGYLEAVFNRAPADDKRLLSLYHDANPANVYAVKGVYTFPVGVTPHDAACTILNNAANRETITPSLWVDLVKDIHGLVSPTAINSVECPGIDGRPCQQATHNHIPDMMGLCTWIDTESV